MRGPGFAAEGILGSNIKPIGIQNPAFSALTALKEASRIQEC
jgi:hypothetical protein